ERCQDKTQDTKQGYDLKICAFPNQRTQTLHRSKISNQPGCGIYRIRRLISGRSGHARDWNFISACLPPAASNVAVYLVGRFCDLWTRRFYRADAAIKNLAKYRNSRAGLGTSAVGT